MNLLEHRGRATVGKVENGRKNPSGAQLFPHQRRFCQSKKKKMAGITKENLISQRHCDLYQQSSAGSATNGVATADRRTSGIQILLRRPVGALRANAITCDARTRKPPGVDWKETKRHLLSPVKSRSSLHEPVGAPWAGNG